MVIAGEEIIKALRSARETKGLSQRELSARTGVPQSHISKIERGNADIRLSSLVELARALELELKLVPRKALPAVESVVRAVAPRPPAGATDIDALKELRRSLATVRLLRDAFPALSDLRTLQENLQVVGSFKDLGRYCDELRSIAGPLRDIRKQADRLKPPREAAALPEEALRQIREAASAAQHLRNRLVHGPQSADAAPRPAYRLDDDEEDGDG
ncbi:helix-turn-helix domain-containing protein [Propylenella binzhouense]|uniref:XRE family transcriptional regulator n=1 Tax=Propylenella binzhouense TaxID=2555902 RepID=A0A964T6Z7_9HYPH|nr:helix-turn-helix transcriptional regulator [Propylenella binzhouense]MYZ49633.1 XRE family transcriptional regulator [Propylenella binzhouense]